MQAARHFKFVPWRGTGQRALHSGLGRCAVHAVDSGALAGRPSDREPKRQQLVAAGKRAQRRLGGQPAAKEDLIIVAARAS
jgi:hypothetical protein